MSEFKQYKVTLTGTTPLLMHADNLTFAAKLSEWRKNPANKELSTAGDDRSPPWTWLGYIYHDSNNLIMPSDNLMTMLRNAGAKVKTGNGPGTYKSQTQAGILIDGEGFDLFINGAQVPVNMLNELVGVLDFSYHIEVAESLGFELFVKRAKIGQAKHVRVRPMFRNWVAEGTITILDEEMTGLTQPILELVLNQGGTLVGLGDWRPSSPRSSGAFGQFKAELTPI